MEVGAGSSGGSKAEPPSGPTFSQFHAVFEKFWQSRMLAPPPPPRRVGAPSYGKSWIRPWVGPEVNKTSLNKSPVMTTRVVGEGVGYPGPMTRGEGYTGMWPIQPPRPWTDTRL